MDSRSQLVSGWRGKPRGGMMSASSAHHSTGNQRSVRVSPRMEGKGQSTKAGAWLVNWSECTTLGESSAHRKRAVCAPITEIHQHHYIVGQQFFLLSCFCCRCLGFWILIGYGDRPDKRWWCHACGRTRQKVMRMSRTRSYQLPSIDVADVMKGCFFHGGDHDNVIKEEWENYSNLIPTIQIN